VQGAYRKILLKGNSTSRRREVGSWNYTTHEIPDGINLTGIQRQRMSCLASIAHGNSLGLAVVDG
jgi:hypothetical protein